MIWGMHSLGPDDKPQSCPQVGRVVRYEKAVRTQVVNRMNRGQDIQAAFEAALADDPQKHEPHGPLHVRREHPECRALSAPGLRVMMYNMGRAPSFMRGQKRPPPSDNVVKLPNDRGGATAANAGLSKNQKKRARQAAIEAKRSSAPAIGAPPVVLAISDAERSKGVGKGAGKGKAGGGLPKGAVAKTGDYKYICFAFNKCEECVQTPCSFVHCCWFCGGDHQGNRCPKN